MAVTADTVQVRLEADTAKYLANLKAAGAQSDKTAAQIAKAATTAAAAATRQASASLQALKASGTATKAELDAARATLQKARVTETAARAEVARVIALRAEAAALKSVGASAATAQTAFARMTAAARTASAGINGALSGVAGAFIGAQAIRGSVQLIDAATAIGNSLRVAGLEGEELTRVYDRLFLSAQKNAAPIQSLAQLYGRVAIVQNELGVSTEELLGLTDNVAKALRVAGTDAQGASGALLQLSQAFGSGVVRAEEFNSILEGALPIAQAAAAGLKEAGGSVARFRQLVVDGKISSEVFFRAIEAGSYILDERLAGAETTVSQAFVRLQNVLIDTAGRMNEGSRISGVLSDGLDNLGEVIAEVAAFAEAAVGPVSNFFAELNGGINVAKDLANELARITGLEQIGANLATGINDLQIPGLSAGSSAYTRVLDQTFSLIGQTPQDETLARILAGEEDPPPLKIVVESDKPTVSLSDYDPPTKSGSGKGRISAADRERQAVLDLIDAMEFERSLISLTAREKAVETAARQAGAAATAEQVEYIRQLAAATYDENEAIQRLNISSQEWADTIQSATRGFIDDLIAGKDAAEAFSNVLSNIANKLIDVGLDNLFGPKGFNLAGILGGTPTRATGGPIYTGGPTLVGEKGPELFIPSTPGKIVPNSQIGGGGVTLQINMDNRGVDPASVARIEQSVQRLAAEVVPTIRKEIANGPKKGRR
jgi:tape measure domain-containing protein